MTADKGVLFRVITSSPFTYPRKIRCQLYSTPQRARNISMSVMCKCVEESAGKKCLWIGISTLSFKYGCRSMQRNDAMKHGILRHVTPCRYTVSNDSAKCLAQWLWLKLQNSQNQDFSILLLAVCPNSSATCFDTYSAVIRDSRYLQLNWTYLKRFVYNLTCRVSRDTHLTKVLVTFNLLCVVVQLQTA